MDWDSFKMQVEEILLVIIFYGPIAAVIIAGIGALFT